MQLFLKIFLGRIFQSWTYDLLMKVVQFCEQDLLGGSNLTSEWSISAELCEVGGGRVVLSPRRLMLAMSHHIPNFNLTAQQVRWFPLNALTA